MVFLFLLNIGKPFKLAYQGQGFLLLSVILYVIAELHSSLRRVFLTILEPHYLNLDPPCVDAGEAGEAARHVGEVVLVLEDVLRLGPDPVHLGPVGQVRLVTHEEGQWQQGRDGGRLLSPGIK